MMPDSMSPCGRPLCTRDEARQLDADLVASGVPGSILMENAGRSATDAIFATFSECLERTVVIGGTGQNGGDAWVVARQLRARGVRPEVVLVGDPARVRGDAAGALKAARAVGIEPHILATEAELDLLRARIDRATLLVDGLFGTGLDRPLEGLNARVVELINEAPCPKVALDLPSGVCADTGRILGTAPRVDMTVTFHAMKWGLVQHPGASLAGRIVVADIGVPPPRTRDRLVGASELEATISARAVDAHKGVAGRVLVVAGSPGKTGAGLLAGLGALRAGAGLVTLAPRGAARALLDAKVVELMTCDVPDDPEAAVARVLHEARDAGAIVLGPGLGLDHEARTLAVQLARELTAPTVLDADALRALADEGGLGLLADAPSARVLTPHPGEAAALLGASVDEVQADRRRAAVELARRSRQTVVLKGAGTVVTDGEACFVCDRGTPALAVGGTGDVLAGAIAARLADRTRSDIVAAAWQAVVAHALAGESAARGRDRGLLAREVADALSDVLGRRRFGARKPRGWSR